MRLGSMPLGKYRIVLACVFDLHGKALEIV
jgi:hypothetical protein